MVLPNSFKSEHLTAAALAYAVMASAQRKGNKFGPVLHQDDEEDQYQHEAIPNIDESTNTMRNQARPSHPHRPHVVTPTVKRPHVNKKKAVVPVVLSTATVSSEQDENDNIHHNEHNDRITSFTTSRSRSTTATPAITPNSSTPRVSAAVLRQMDSRRRVRNAMEHYQAKTPKVATVTTPKPLTATVVVTPPIREVPPTTSTATKPRVAIASSVRNAPSVSSSNPTLVTPTTTQINNNTTNNISSPTLRKRIPSSASAAPIDPSITTPAVTTTTTPPRTNNPPSGMNSQLIRFKAKSITNNTVLRFQCEPTFEAVRQNILKRLGSHTVSTRDNNTIVIKFQDDDSSDGPGGEDGDWCIMSSDEDVRDAVSAAATRNDTMVRLEFQEQDSSSMWKLGALGGYVSNYFGW